MYKLFGIPNCDTVKKARTFLEKKKASVDFIDFKKYRPTVEDIQRWSEVFGGLPVNTKGVTYKKHKELFETLSAKDKVSFIQDNTSMIKRPILEKGSKVMAFGFDEEAYKSLVK
ncbi:MAG: arsenate reductase family protein [Bacteriovoracia bacterium]